MKKLFAALAGAFVLLATLWAVPTAANATPNDPVVDVWVTWNVVNGSKVADPKGADDVNWPQTLVGNGQIAPTDCGVLYQQDRYKAKQSVIDKVLYDHQLAYGEDFSIVKEWHFVWGPKCKPPQPESIGGVEHRQVDACTEPKDGTRTTLFQDRHWTQAFDVWNEQTWSWDKGDVVYTDDWTTVDTGVLDDESCAAEVTPTPTPTPTDTPKPTPTPTHANPTPHPSQTVVNAAARQAILPETGNDVPWLLVGVGGLALFIGIGALLLARRART